MDTDILAIFDSDRDYLEKFINYFYMKQGDAFECHGFTDINKLIRYSREQKIGVLLVNADLVSDDVKRISAGIILALGDEDTEFAEENIRSLNRYQATDGIIKEIMEHLAEHEASGEEPKRRFLKTNTSFTAVYSPVKRTYKTTFAIALGQFFSDRGRTLYINLEECAGFNQIFKTNYGNDLSDLLFFIKSGKKNFRYKLQSTVMNTHGLDYIPPVMAAADILEVSKTDWMEFLDEISSCEYERAVIDIGDCVQGTEELLERCDTIYMPVRQDSAAKAKVTQFEALMHQKNREELLTKIIRLELPYDRNITSFAGDCRNTELGNYTRRLIGGCLNEG